MKKLEPYIHPYWGMIVLAVLIKLVSALTELMIPYLMEIILDVKVAAGRWGDILACGELMLLCAGVSMGFNVWSNRMSAVSSGEITRAIRHDLFRKLELLSARQMDGLTVSSAESRITSDTYNLNQFFAGIQRVGVRAPIVLVGGIIVMFSMDAVLALVLVCLLPFIVLITWAVTRVTVSLYSRQQKLQDRIVEVVQENITGIRVVRALGRTDYERRRFQKVNAQMTELDKKAGFATAFSNPAPSLVMNIGLTLAVVIGGWRVHDGEMSSGVIVAFLQYFTMILTAMLGVTRMFIQCSKGKASARRVTEVLEMEEEMGREPKEAREPNCPYLEFRNVSFAYRDGADVLSHISFRLEKGQTLGILGPTGAGKSTLINLLLRFYDPDQGAVYLEGQNIKQADPEKLREKFGVVFQNDFVSSGTFSDNIRFFRWISREDQREAARNAQADFIDQKENGMESHVAFQGNDLSGGQRQRLLIARALAGKPEILILDDASSALDYRTDAELRKAMRREYRETTVVLVAQRVSSLRHADQILVLSGGELIGAGTHEQLMENCSAYRAIAKAQSGKEKEG